MFTIDLIIPTYKPGPEFEETLRRLALQTVKPDYLKIVNTGQENWNERLSEVYPDLSVTHIPKEAFDHGTTRYEAAKDSEADILIFMTQDALPLDETLIEKLIAPLTEQKAAVSYARQLPAEDADPIERITRKVNYPEESMLKTKAELPALGVKTFFCSNVCAAYDRRIYEELGGFPHPTQFNEDMIFAAKLIEAGHTISYTADAKVIHSHSYTGKQQYERNFLIGKTQAEHPEVFEKYPSEGAGVQLVKSTAKELIRTGKGQYIFKLVWQSGCKYLGYRAGKRSVK